MFIPKNHDKIQTISELFRGEMNQHEAQGGTYYDDKAGHIAARAIHYCMPELMAMQQSRIIVEADSAITLSDKESDSYTGVRLEAQLARVSIEQIVSTFTDEGEPPVIFSDFDLTMVLRPQYVDPDPQDLVFGSEIVIPFRDITLFESAR